MRSLKKKINKLYDKHQNIKKLVLINYTRKAYVCACIICIKKIYKEKINKIIDCYIIYVNLIVIEIK